MKCPNCNAEVNGKFCHECGTRMPDLSNNNIENKPNYPICSNCGAEVNGKFCIRCGNPVETPIGQTPSQSTADFAQPMSDGQYGNYQQSNSVRSDKQTQNNGNNYGQEPKQYSGQQFTNQQRDYSGQQFSNEQKDYTGQQFSNSSTKNLDAKKTGLDKSGVIVVCVVIGIIILLIGIFGFVACSLIKSAGDAIEKSIDSISDMEDSDVLSGIFDEFTDDDEFSIDYDIDFDLDVIGDETGDNPLAKGDEFDSVTGYYNESTFCYYSFNDDDTGVVIIDFNQYEGAVYKDNKMIIEIPEKINNLPVVEIYHLSVINHTGEDQYIKVIIPGSVKTIDKYAMSFSQYIDEVVIKDGVKTIESGAFYGCEELEKIHIPKSVESLEDCGIGLDLGDDFEDIISDDLVIYGKKGSKAEKYAKNYGFKFVEE